MTLDDNKRRVVVISNRLPNTLKRAASGWRTEKSAGGLTTAMEPVLKQSNGIWIGWTGDDSELDDGTRRKILDQWQEKHAYIAVDLPARVSQRFYEGYSNQTLWPLFHNVPSSIRLHPEEWHAYVEANERFRDVTLKHLRPDDLIWIHDYHLMLLPRLLREARPGACIGFFLHIPFPPSLLFRVLPQRADILNGLLGADYLAFHTHSYVEHFRQSMLRVLGLASEMDRVSVNGREVRLEAVPIGVAPDDFTALIAHDKDTNAHLTELRHRFKCFQVMLAVDRLDYTKGIPLRLRAFRRFLTDKPEWREKVVLVQVAVPSRKQVPMYRRLRRDVDELVGKINGEFGTTAWTPIVYFRRNLPRPELAALYAVADVALVTPLMDGLNLVAKEYVACHPQGDGVLMLSEFAGAAAEMGEALLVNPYDEEQMVATMEQALATPNNRERMLAVHERVVRNNVFAWSERFLMNLDAAAEQRSRQFNGDPQPLPVATLTEAFRNAESRLLMLDYDGTLSFYTRRPEDAMPRTELLATLESLADISATTVAIVSGRSRQNVAAWFERLRSVWLIAEHGAVLRAPGSAEWRTLGPDGGGEWKPRVKSVLDEFAARTPGSFIEEKEFSLVWHYRMADPEFGEWLANMLAETLDQMLGQTPLRVVKGEKIVEVRMAWANKGTIFEHLIAAMPSPGFMLAAGDDVTDEDLFARLPGSAWTIHVGNKPSRARFRLSDPSEMWQLLSLLAKDESEQLITQPNRELPSPYAGHSFAQS